MKIRLSGIIPESIVDGPGIRYTIFTQGCLHHCPGCHNPGTHDPEGGYLEDTAVLLQEIQKNPLVKGVTFSGGEPFMQPLPLADLAKQVHLLGKDVITYTGYTFEYLYEHLDQHPDWRQLLEQTDILIDGPFIRQQKSLDLKYRGSANQRLLDAKASLAAGKPVEMEL